jgi:hypothetical protein
MNSKWLLLSLALIVFSFGEKAEAHNWYCVLAYNPGSGTVTFVSSFIQQPLETADGQPDPAMAEQYEKYIRSRANITGEAIPICLRDDQAERNYTIKNSPGVQMVDGFQPVRPAAAEAHSSARNTPAGALQVQTVTDSPTATT